MSSELYGWVGARDDILSAYATACLEASNCLLYTSDAADES